MYGVTFEEDTVRLELTGQPTVEIPPLALIETATFWLQWAKVKKWEMRDTRGLRIVSQLPLGELTRAIEQYEKAMG